MINFACAIPSPPTPSLYGAAIQHAPPDKSMLPAQKLRLLFANLAAQGRAFGIKEPGTTDSPAMNSTTQTRRTNERNEKRQSSKICADNSGKKKGASANR
jgi:hypothetical protein